MGRRRSDVDAGVLLVLFLVNVVGGRVDFVGGQRVATLGIGRPDLLAEQEQAFGSGVRIIDLEGEVDGCTLEYDSSRPVLGGASATGLCDNGGGEVGYALTVDGNLSLRRTCTTMTDTIAVSFDGTAAIEQL